MITKLKICGIRSVEEIEALGDLAIDYFGCIFAENSKRYVNTEQEIFADGIDRTVARRLQELVNTYTTAIRSGNINDRNAILGSVKACVIS